MEGPQRRVGANFERAYLFSVSMHYAPRHIPTCFVELEPNARIAAAHGTPHDQGASADDCRRSKGRRAPPACGDSEEELWWVGSVEVC